MSGYGKQGNELKNNHDNLLKNKNSFKVKKWHQNAKKLKIFSLKIHKDAGIKKNPEIFVNKGTKHKKNYIEGLNSKNKNIKGSGSP